MIQTIKHKIIFMIFVCLLIGATKTLAFDCPLLTTEQAVEQSKAVFSGEVDGFEYRKDIPNWFMNEQAKEIGKVIEYETLVVKVQINQWWKGEPPTEFYLSTSSTRNADGTSLRNSCDYTFYKGETYLMFATKFNTKKENEYRTSDCLKTRKLSAADNDLKILSEGKKPSANLVFGMKYSLLPNICAAILANNCSFCTPGFMKLKGSVFHTAASSI